MKKHITVARYFTITSSDVDMVTDEVTCVPRERDVIVIKTKKGKSEWFIVERVVWCVGKMATEVQIRLTPYVAV